MSPSDTLVKTGATESEVWLVQPCAKINLGLHVLERLENGYHRIETGFCFIDWCDDIEIRRAKRYQLELPGSAIPAGPGNLVTKAYDLFKREVGLRSEYAFRVSKRIPAGAGLGGGSSDAAAVLRALNEIEKAGLSTDDLVALGSRLGSDLSIFITGKTGIGQGTGVEIESLDLQPDAWIVTVWPGFESSTAEAYALCEPEPNPVLPLRQILTEESLSEWEVLLMNDLEPPVVARYDMVGLLKAQLYEFGATYASMTGSGSALFGVFEQEFVAIHALESLSNLGYQANLTGPRFTPDLSIKRRL